MHSGNSPEGSESIECSDGARGDYTYFISFHIKNRSNFFYFSTNLNFFVINYCKNIIDILVEIIAIFLYIKKKMI